MEPMIAGRYTVGEVIGTGGMGQVRAGHDTKLDRPVAIKLLRSDLLEQTDLKVRFESEAKAAARITHPNVVGVFDTGEHEGVPYIVMELLSGHTLADELNDGALEPARVKRIGLEILSALDASHEQGILHRDVKPGNVLISRDGTIKVADFGVAKITEGMNLTMAGTMIGTPSYLAPERVNGEPANASTDVYSVGVVLYELLTGTRPFDADTPLGLLHAIQNTHATPLAEICSDLDSGFCAAVDKAMAKDPADRYQDARSMLLDLGVEPAAEVLETTEVLEVPGPATKVISTPIANPETEPTPRPIEDQRTRVDHPVIPVRRRLTRTSGSAWHRLSRRNQIGAAIGAILILFFIVSLIRPDTGAIVTPTAPDQSADTVAGTPANLEDALNRLEDAVQP